MAPSISAPIDWLSKRQQFLDGTNCDMIIKVHSDTPAAKRTKQGDGRQQEDGLVVEIPAHFLVLSSRSDYFTNAFRHCGGANQDCGAYPP